jgi:glycosyltransferase involved in cell wall biosynthesis
MNRGEQMAQGGRPLRILFYNWVDYLDDERRGGGVSVYQRNLMNAFAESTDIDARFLSAGLSYDLVRSAPRWQPIRHGDDAHRDRRFEIVNSGTFAPGHDSFGLSSQLDHPPTMAAFVAFLRATGPYDIVHFNNLEGLPASVLELPLHVPGTRVILSLHNYYPICPQVNLWNRETTLCTDFDDGRACPGCVPPPLNAGILRLAHGTAYHLKRAGIRPGTPEFATAFGLIFKAGRKTIALSRRLQNRAIRIGRRLRRFVATDKHAPVADGQNAGQAFADRRRRMIELINTHCDRVLCVSDRVAEVAANYGIAGDRLQTAYIGTAHAAKFAETTPRQRFLKHDGTLCLGYLGYMRRDKGFFFLLDALEALPDPIARRLRLLVAARRGDDATMARLDALAGRLASMTHIDGYSHDTLDGILAEVDLGVIPVLWEDNLPQVAIEMHARHIPLLCSDLGGAKELGNCPALVFPAGNRTEFANRLESVMAGRVLPAAYWASAMAPVSMQQHLAALREIYGSTVATGPGPRRSRTNGASVQATDTEGSYTPARPLANSAR